MSYDSGWIEIYPGQMSRKDLADALLAYMDVALRHPVASQAARGLVRWLRERSIELCDTKALLALIHSGPIPRRVLRPMRRILKRINRRTCERTGFPLPPKAWWDLIESSHVRQIPQNPLGSSRRR